MCARSSPSASRTSTISVSPTEANLPTSSTRAADGSLRPQPGRSSSSLRNPCSRDASGAQLVPLLLTPWTNSTAGPSPITCTRTRVPALGNSSHSSAGSTPSTFQYRRSAARYFVSSTPTAACCHRRTPGDVSGLERVRAAATVQGMEIVAALFVEGIEFRQVEGPSTRIDITGVFFSTAVDAYPASLTPHLVVLVRSPDGSDGNGTLETVFVRESGRGGRPQPPAVLRGARQVRLPARARRARVRPSRARSKRAARSSRAAPR